MTKIKHHETKHQQKKRFKKNTTAPTGKNEPVFEHFKDQPESMWFFGIKMAVTI